MKILLPFFTSLIVLSSVTPLVRAAEVTDVAELFPADTLAYIELTNPAELSPQLAAVFKGTALEDSILFIHKRRDAGKNVGDLQSKPELAALGLFTSPEMLAEFKKLRGAAIGVVGFTPSGDPEAALAVLTGDSAAAGLAARAFLTMTSNLRKVGEVSRVPVFQYRNPNVSFDMMGQPILENDKPPAESAHDISFAYTPGLFLIGTSKTAVGHCIKRYLGEEKGGFAGTNLFKDAGKQYRHSGLFYVVNVRELAARYDTANKAKGGLTEPDAFGWFKLMVNPKAVISAAGCLRFKDGSVSASLSCSLDAKEKSPLLELLSGPEVKTELTRPHPRASVFSCVATLPEKNRAAAVITFLDSIGKSTGELGKLPSDFIKEMQEKYKTQIGEGLIGKTRAVGLVVPVKQELPKGAKPLPILVLHTDDEAAAVAWEEFLPKLFAEVANAKKVPQPFAETIGGVKVSSIVEAGFPWKGPIHFARTGTVVAVGLDRKLVAAALSPDPAGPAGKGPVVLAGDSAVMVGKLSIVDAVVAVLENRPGDGNVIPDETIPEPPLGGFRQAVPQELIEEAKKARQEFFAAVEKTGPATLTVRRTGSTLNVELVQPNVAGGGLKSLIDAGALWLDRQGSLMGNQRQFGGLRDF